MSCRMTGILGSVMSSAMVSVKRSLASPSALPTSHSEPVVHRMREVFLVFRLVQL